MLTRRLSIFGGSGLVLAGLVPKAEAKPSPAKAVPTDAVVEFDEKVTAMCEFGIDGKIAVACGNKIYVVKLQ